MLVGAGAFLFGALVGAILTHQYMRGEVDELKFRLSKSVKGEPKCQRVLEQLSDFDQNLN